jgi:glycolate oxidase iron-sulfur subunit
MAERLGRRKVEHVLEVRPQIVATANPGCALQIAGGARSAGASIEVLHVVQVLDRAYTAGEAAASA